MRSTLPDHLPRQATPFPFDHPTVELPFAAGRRRRQRWTPVVVAAVPAAATAVVGWAGIGDRTIWQNEVAAVHAAQLSWPDLWRLLTTIDMVKGLYFAGLHLWTAVAGDSLTALRLPSLAALVVAAAATALVGRRLFGPAVGMGAGLLLAATPSVSRFAGEISVYGFVTAAVALTTLLLLRAYDEPTPARWTWYGVAVTGAAMLHVVTLLTLVAHWVLYRRAVRSRPDDDAPVWPLPAFLGALAATPMLWLGQRQSGAISWIRMGVDEVLAYPAELLMSAAVAVIVWTAAAIGLLAGLSRPATRADATFLAVWAVLPPVLGMATFPWLHLFLPRYYLFTLPALAILAAAGVHAALRQLRGPATVRVAGVLVLVAAVTAAGLPGQRQVRQSPTDGRPDLHSATMLVAQRQRSGDGVAFGGVESQYYGRDLFDYELRDRPRPRDVFLQTPGSATGRYEGTECPEAAECVAGTARVWLVTTAVGRDPLTELTGTKAAVLRSMFDVVEVHEFHKARVVLLVRRPAPPG
ncbi:hypothetical protein GCM10010399_28960 [Dactylosporangium fulvum]|uniref:Glycosyltransferase family 39 protein n=1 Tax=Dactylosporangium fulvum TaxID=53359 RepID=A0ABY5WAU2_9ACTN|nr:glycosyltransferase family 39 protein [Dactylosporangium fulvum]UWP86236.1 glycosyltransferase family 39 protein [Dactylosporangium fulvum]